MTFVLLLPLKANAPDSTARPRTALRCVRKAPMTRRHPRLLRSRRVSPLVASRTPLRRLPLPSSVLRLKLGRGHRHEGAVLTAHSSFGCLGRTFYSRLAGCAHATGHCCADAQWREVFGKPYEFFNGDESPADPTRSASYTSQKAPRAHPSLRDKSHPSRPPHMGAHKAVTKYASPPDSAISSVAAEESAQTQRNPSRCYGLRHVRR